MGVAELLYLFAIPLLMKAALHTVLFLFLVAGTASAQVGVGTTVPHSSAALDISSTSGGLLPPRLTWGQIQSIPNPAAGLNSNGIFCFGHYTGTTDLNPAGAVASFTSLGGNDVFLARYTSAGLYNWGRSYGGSLDDQAVAMATNGTDVWITGTFFSPTFQMYSYSVQRPGALADCFLARINQYSDEEWVHTAGGKGYDYAQDLDVGDFGRTVVALGDMGSRLFISYQKTRMQSLAMYVARYAE